MSDYDSHLDNYGDPGGVLGDDESDEFVEGCGYTYDHTLPPGEWVDDQMVQMCTECGAEIISLREESSEDTVQTKQIHVPVKDENGAVIGHAYTQSLHADGSVSANMEIHGSHADDLRGVSRAIETDLHTKHGVEEPFRISHPGGKDGWYRARCSSIMCTYSAVEQYPARAINRVERHAQDKNHHEEEKRNTT